MRIETRTEDDLPHVAMLDADEARVLSRTLDPVLRWISDLPATDAARLRRGDVEDGISASFATEGALKEFLGRFLPGKVPAHGLLLAA